MKALALVSLLLIAAAPGENEWIHLGEQFTLEEEIPIPELVEHPEKYHNRIVRISGMIASVCNEDGCFIEVIPEDGISEGVVVNFPGLKHKFPLDCAGQEAVAEGIFFQKIYPSVRVSHWQHHSFKEGRKVPEYALIMRMEAEAVKIGGRRVAIPEPSAIRESSPYRIELDVMEFEDEGFGIGRRQIEPGAVKQRRGKSRAREMIVCLEGSIVVYKRGAEPVVLNSGEMAFIPIAIDHEIRNEGKETAAYVFIYAREIEEKKEHDH